MEPHSRPPAGAAGTRSSRTSRTGGRTSEGVAETVETSGRTQRSGGQAQQQSIGIVDKIKGGATTQLTNQKDRATEGIGTLAQAVRQTTERLRHEEHDTIAQYVERAADQLERLSEGLRQKDVNELFTDAQRFARRQPALFIGGSFAAGLLLARFLKSSRERGTADYGQVTSRSSLDLAASEMTGDY